MKKYQNGSLQLSKFGTHNNVKTISLLFSNDQISYDSNEVGSLQENLIQKLMMRKDNRSLEENLIKKHMMKKDNRSLQENQI